MIKFTAIKNKIIYDSKIKNLIYYNESNLKYLKINNLKLIKLNKLIDYNFKNKFKDSYKINPDLKLIFSSSGTTSDPKLIVINKKNILAQINQINVRHKIQDKKRLYTPMPINHIGALFFILLNGFFFKKEVNIINYLDPNKFIEILIKTKPNFLYLNPTIINALNLIKIDSKALKSRATIFCGSAPLSKSSLASFLKNFNKIKFIQVYGLTESTNTLTTVDEKDIKHDLKKIYFNSEHPSVGTPLKNVNIKLIKNKKFITKENIIGELIAKGPNIIKSYYKKKFNKNKFFLNFFRTGDLGYFKILNKKKYFYLVGRNDDMIICDGFNINLNELDNYLNKNKIHNSISIGIRDPLRGSVPVIITTNKKIYAANINYNKNLPYYMKFRRIYFLEKFSVTLSGKLKKNYMSNYIIKNNIKFKIL